MYIKHYHALLCISTHQKTAFPCCWQQHAVERLCHRNWMPSASGSKPQVLPLSWLLAAVWKTRAAINQEIMMITIMQSCIVSILFWVMQRNPIIFWLLSSKMRDQIYAVGAGNLWIAQTRGNSSLHSTSSYWATGAISWLNKVNIHKVQVRMKLQIS